MHRQESVESPQLPEHDIFSAALQWSTRFVQYNISKIALYFFKLSVQ